MLRSYKLSVHCYKEIAEKIMWIRSHSCMHSKNYLEYFIKSYTHIVYLSLVNGKFVDTWKCVILRPLIKRQGAGTLKTKYHPISNLSFLSKVTEKCVQEWFSVHSVVAMKNSEYQSAYKEGHSCEMALIKILHESIWAMENKKFLLLCCCI